MVYDTAALWQFRFERTSVDINNETAVEFSLRSIVNPYSNALLLSDMCTKLYTSTDFRGKEENYFYFKRKPGIDCNFTIITLKLKKTVFRMSAGSGV